MKRPILSPVNYPLEWFDVVCNETLNPKKNNVQELTPEQVNSLLDKFNNEFIDLQSHIKAHLIQLTSPKKVRTAVMQYHTAVLLLNQQAATNCNNYPSKDDKLKLIGKRLLSLTEELVLFLERRYSTFIISKNSEVQETGTVIVPVTPIKFKILCNLSADQIGLILKAADDVKIILARSLSTVFKYIVPFLATHKSNNISWESMRSHSYTAEETDKEVVIQKLEAMIKKIKTY